MKTDIKKIGECKRLLKIELSPEMVQGKFAEVYRDLKITAAIPGFRTGKVPQDLLEKHYGKAAIDEVTQRLIWESLEKAVREVNLNPISSPQIKDVKLRGRDAFSFKAEIEIRPQVKLKNYKRLKVKKGKIEVSDKDVEEVLLRLQEMNAQLSPVTGRPAKKGDWLLCDCKSLKPQKATPEATGDKGDNHVQEKKNIWIALEESRSPKELIDGLVGAGISEMRTVKEGEVTHSIEVKEIKEKNLPALNDDFAHTVGKCKNLAELKELIRKDLIQRNEAKVKLDMRSTISEQLLKGNVFNCPSSLIEKELEHLVNEAKLRLIYQGLEKEKVVSQEDKMKGELMAEATRRVRLAFILDQIAHEEKIHVPPQEVEDKLKLIKEKTDQKINLKEKDLRNNIHLQLREEKTIDFLLQEAKIEEVS